MKGAVRLILITLILFATSTIRTNAQKPDPRVSRLIKNMTVEEKIGQLFIVAFPGDDVSPTSDIGRLILQYKIGGVLLSAKNGNFRNDANAPLTVARLTAALQGLALRDQGPGIPLFIAVQHDGNGYPATELRTGMTAIPSPLAIGATWDPENARTVGKIVGRELAAVGINMLLGPPLDVLHTPRPGQPGDLRTASFGGSPYWVGRMGEAYIQGIHQGSRGRVITIAKHFPGYGSSDRDPEEEVPTVDKSLEELKRTDLVPFIAVTDVENNPLFGVTDGLMTSHLRYRGFQGPTPPGSPPLSFHPGGLQVAMGLPELAPWRETGLLMSDSLGVPAVRRQFSPKLESFPHKEIAQKALLAGNDLLLVSRFALEDNDWPTQFANITSAIRFFREQYEADDTFRARVDAALQRILRLKTHLYPDFDLGSVTVDLTAVSKTVGQDEARGEIAAIMKDAITLVAPSLNELADRLPSGPRSGEPIVIFTDARQVTECPDCEPVPLIPPTAIEETILRLYGPQGIGQIDPEQIQSYTFAQLKALLTPPEDQEQAAELGIPMLSEEEKAEIEAQIEQAMWIVFAMQDINPDVAPASDALRVFLKERANELANKHVIVLAFDAPYYLDATEISKLTAYYAIYSKIPAAIEAAVRALFQQFPPVGALPVSVSGATYDLTTQLQPDPAQEITLTRVDSEDQVVELGQEFTIQTSVILDKNGHPVPDGTKVTFWLTDPTDSTYLDFQEVQTKDGVAAVTLIANRAGPVEIRAQAGEAQTTEPLALVIQAPAAPSPTPEPPTATPTVTVTPTPTATPTPTPTPTPPQAPAPVGWESFLLSVFGMLIAGVLVMSVENGNGSVTVGLRLFLSSIAVGLIGYLLVALRWLQVRELPMVGALPQTWHAPAVSFTFALAPLAWALWQRRENR